MASLCPSPSLRVPGPACGPDLSRLAEGLDGCRGVLEPGLTTVPPPRAKVAEEGAYLPHPQGQATVLPGIRHIPVVGVWLPRARVCPGPGRLLGTAASRAESAGRAARGWQIPLPGKAGQAGGQRKLYFL